MCVCVCVCVCVSLYMCVCVCVCYSVQLNRSEELFRLDQQSLNYEHLSFPGKELNVTDITEQL